MSTLNPAFPAYGYVRLYIPTGARNHCEERFTSRRAFLEQLDRWNAQQPGVWQYWSA